MTEGAFDPADRGNPSFRTVPSMCPCCGTMMEGARHASPRARRAPKRGDIGLCAYCGNINQYDANLCLLQASQFELSTLEAKQPDEYARLLKTQAMIRAARVPPPRQRTGKA